MKKIKAYFNRSHSVKEFDVFFVTMILIGASTLLSANISIYYAQIFAYLSILTGITLIPLLFFLKPESKNAKIEKNCSIIVIIFYLAFLIYLLNDNFESYKNFNI